MSKRNRKLKPGSRRDLAEKGKKEYIEKLRSRLDEKGALNEQEWRSYEHLMQRKRKREVQKVSETKDVLPEGKLKEWVETYYIQHRILKALNLPTGKEGVEKLLELHGYYVCSFCGYSHVKDELCPFKIEAEKHSISLDPNPKPTKEDIIEREVEKLLIEKE